MTDLVVISLEVWDEVWRRNQHLVSGLLSSGAADRVLFVEPPVDSLHEIRRGRRPGPGGTGLRRIETDRGELWAVRDRKVLPRRLDPAGDARRARRVARRARGLGMDRPVLWVNDPGGAAVMAATGWPALYDITDDWLVADRPEAELVRTRGQEEGLLERCVEVVVCSPALQVTKSAGRDVVLVPNAVDPDPYRTRAARPADLPRGPVALYLGTVHRDRIDIDLCVLTARRVAELEPAAQVVLIGPAPLSTDDLHRLQSAGVAVLGPRSSETVPGYLQHADALLVPHVLTEFTRSLDPIKAYEYRAAGRPVVATAVPGFVEADDPLVSVREGEAFAEAVAEIVTAQHPWTSVGVAGVPTWAQRADQMAEVIRRVEAAGRA